MSDYKTLIAEAREESLKRFQMNDDLESLLDRLADALEAVTADRAEVEAQALEAAADSMERSWRMGLLGNEFAWLRARASEIREGRA